MYQEHAKRVVEGIETVVVKAEWSDDHIPCASANVQFKDGSNIDMTFWWAGREGVAALNYYDSPRAKADLVSLFESYLESESDNLFALQDDSSLYKETNDEGRQKYDAANAIFTHFKIPVEFND